MVDAVDFVAAMAGVATPVSVVTSHRRERPHATTVSAFCSPSLDPPMVLGFARKGPDRFAGVDWALHHGVPRLEGAATTLALHGAER